LTALSGGDRSRFFDRAVKAYVRGLSRANLRKKLKEEAIAWADYDLKLAAEWFPLEEEAWQKEAELRLATKSARRTQRSSSRTM
jgi:hypothetical protein